MQRGGARGFQPRPGLPAVALRVDMPEVRLRMGILGRGLLALQQPADPTIQCRRESTMKCRDCGAEIRSPFVRLQETLGICMQCLRATCKKADALLRK